MIRGFTACRVTLYTRPGCHLCEEAEDLLLMLGQETPIELRLVNILDDAGLYERYKWAIPVIAIENGATLSAPIDPVALRVALQSSSPTGGIPFDQQP